MGKGSTWIRKELQRDLSPLGETVADLLDDLFEGIQHLRDEHLELVNWLDQHCIEVRIGIRGGFATYAPDRLTQLVFLAHDRALRVGVEPATRYQMRWIFWQHQHGPDGPLYHPTLEEAAAGHRKRYPLTSDPHACTLAEIRDFLVRDRVILWRKVEPQPESRWNVFPNGPRGT